MKYHPKTWFIVLDLFILGPLYREFHIGWDGITFSLWSHTQVASQCMASGRLPEEVDSLRDSQVSSAQRTMLWLRMTATQENSGLGSDAAKLCAFGIRCLVKIQGVSDLRHGSGGFFAPWGHGFDSQVLPGFWWLDSSGEELVVGKIGKEKWPWFVGAMIYTVIPHPDCYEFRSSHYIPIISPLFYLPCYIFIMYPDIH